MLDGKCSFPQSRKVTRSNLYQKKGNRKNVMVVFDLLCSQPVNGVKFHGGGEYTKTIFREYVLKSTTNERKEIIVCYNFDGFLDDWLLTLINDNNIQKINVKCKQEIVDVIKKFSGNCPITFYAGLAYDYGDIVFPENVYRIGTFHGLRSLEKPYDKVIFRYVCNLSDIKVIVANIFFRKYFYKKNYNAFLKSMRNYDCIITVSEYSKYSIISYFPEIKREKRIERLYPPLKYSFITGREVSTQNNKYIMMVSGGRWLKNAYRGMRAIDELYSKGFLKGVKTRIYGGKPKWGIFKLKNLGNFEFFSYVGEEELETAYRNCELFFYPTLNEGFGSPPLEAMKYGKTALISSVCSLTEIYGDAVYYTNPYDQNEMQNRILNALDRPKERELIQKRVEVITKMQRNDVDTLIQMIKNPEI